MWHKNIKVDSKRDLTTYMKNYFTTYKSPLTVVLAMLILGGLFAYSKLQTSLFPEITFPKIKIMWALIW